MNLLWVYFFNTVPMSMQVIGELMMLLMSVNVSMARFER